MPLIAKLALNGPLGNWIPGQELRDVPSDVAETWIRDGAAELVEDERAPELADVAETTEETLTDAGAATGEITSVEGFIGSADVTFEADGSLTVNELTGSAGVGTTERVQPETATEGPAAAPPAPAGTTTRRRASK